MDEQPADLDSAQSRSTRFGRLPERIEPDATVETVQTASPQGRPDPAVTEDQQRALFDGS